MKTQYNKFEMATHDYLMKRNKKRASWEHTVKTYTDNGRKIDWIVVGMAIMFFMFALGALTALVS